MYQTRWWKAARIHQLQIEPLCARCRFERGEIVAATVVHHTIPHNGNWDLFTTSPLQSLCKFCHDSTMQSIERLGYDKAKGHGDWAPVNPYSGPYAIPSNVQASVVPVILVCGAPGSGKTTYARANKQTADRIIDLDDIRQSLGYQRNDASDIGWQRSMSVRDDMIRNIHLHTTGRIFLIVTAPTQHERKQWCDVLGPLTTVHECVCSPSICKQRIGKDKQRDQMAKQKLYDAIDRYFQKQQQQYLL